MPRRPPRHRQGPARPERRSRSPSTTPPAAASRQEATCTSPPKASSKAKKATSRSTSSPPSGEPIETTHYLTVHGRRKPEKAAKNRNRRTRSRINPRPHRRPRWHRLALLRRRPLPALRHQLKARRGPCYQLENGGSGSQAEPTSPLDAAGNFYLAQQVSEPPRPPRSRLTAAADPLSQRRTVQLPGRTRRPEHHRARGRPEHRPRHP